MKNMKLDLFFMNNWILVKMFEIKLKYTLNCPFYWVKINFRSVSKHEKNLGKKPADGINKNYYLKLIER